MFTAVTTFCSSLMGFAKESYIYIGGEYHVGMYQIDGEELAKVQADKRFGKSCYAQVLGYAEVPVENEDKPYLYVEGVDGKFIDQMSLHLTQGRFAQNDSEIVLPAHVVTNGKLDIRLGDSLTLAIGERMAGDIKLDQSKAFDYCSDLGDEYIKIRLQRTYTVVGFVERPDSEERTAPGYTAFTAESKDSASIDSYNFYSLIKDTNKNFEAISNEYPINKVYNAMLMFSGYAAFSNWNTFLYGLAGIFVVMILIGSILLIYSAFSISVSERTKQFGLLSSIGATRKQVQKSVLYEALIYSAVGIPIGLLIGMAGIGITLFCCRDLFDSLFSSGNAVTMRIHVSIAAIIIAVIIALTTVLISAWIPSRRAMKISPLEAIRQSRDVKLSKRDVRYTKAFVKLFGASGVLAKKYYSRSRKKYRATVIALALSLMLFISASSFCMYLTKSVDMGIRTMEYDLELSIDYEDYKKIGERIGTLPGVTRAAALVKDRDGVTIFPYSDSLTDEFKTHFSSIIAADDVLNEGVVSQQQIHPLDIADYYIEDSVFKQLIAQNGLDIKNFLGDDGAVLIFNHAESTKYEDKNGSTQRFTYSYDCFKQNTEEFLQLNAPNVPEGYELYGTAFDDSGKLVHYFTPYNEEVDYDELGRPIGCPTEEAGYRAVKIGGLISEQPVGVPVSNAMAIIRPFSSLPISDKTDISIILNSDNPDKTVNDIKLLMEEESIFFADSMMYNYAESERSMRSINTLVKVFSYGFIVLISLISVANVFNTISTNVSLRRRDYAMLRSMGMSANDMKRMTNYECLAYGSRAILIGLPLATIFSYLTYKVSAETSEISFTLPWTSVGIAILSVFVVVFASMLYATNKLDNDNPVEVLKNENI